MGWLFVGRQSHNHMSSHINVYTYYVIARITREYNVNVYTYYVIARITREYNVNIVFEIM